MSRAVRLCAIVVAAAIAASCGGRSEAPGAGGGRAFLSFGTAPPGGAFFVVGGALTEVLNARTEEGWNVTGESTSGSQENIRRLSTGELDFALSNAAITYFAVRGTEGWDRAYPMRAVMTLAPNVALFITRTGSRITRIADLKGKRVVVGPAGAGFEYFVKPLLEAHGVTYADFTPLNATQSSAVDMLTDGSAAAAFIGGAVPTASITQASASMDIFFVPFDEEAVAKLAAAYVFFDRAVIPAGTYRGQTADFHGLDVGSMHIITAADQDADLVYRVTKALYENREQVVQRHAAGNAINPKNVVRDTGTEFHAGAIRYYREIGIWRD
ncbi:MAG TPA: TAXI family TRAP transporter solute-binding subunit [Vicinamibacterales bacterium]|nr:TAXI family TRAP transporter solute-binding subunit [Vicinamibacterales bacterium]